MALGVGQATSTIAVARSRGSVVAAFAIAAAAVASTAHTPAISLAQGTAVVQAAVDASSAESAAVGWLAFVFASIIALALVAFSVYGAEAAEERVAQLQFSCVRQGNQHFYNGERDEQRRQVKCVASPPAFDV